MVFWFLCAILTVAVTVLTLRPLMVRADSDQASIADNPDLRVYKEQLAELERDIKRGLLSGEEAEASRLEISRRILAAVPEDANPAQVSSSSKSVASGSAFYLIAGLMVLSSVAIYMTRGSPGYGGQPFAERVSRSAADSPVSELIARVEARLREAPGDGRGWDVLAPVYLKQQRYSDAITAFEKAIGLLGENRARLRGLAEAHLGATNGIVSEVVRQAYRKILAKEPNLVAPRFWLAVGLEQDGDRVAAQAAYKALLRTETGNSATKLPPALEQLIQERLAALGSSVEGNGKSPAGSAASGRQLGSEAGKGPPPPAEMAAGMAPKEQAEMIERMVSGLAERLNANGGTEQEWQRLIRAYWVMGRRDDAAATLVKAKKQYTGEAGIGERLDAFARQLGMQPG